MTIENSYIAVIHNSDDTQLWKDMAEDLYPANVVPWDKGFIKGRTDVLPLTLGLCGFTNTHVGSPGTHTTDPSVLDR